MSRAEDFRTASDAWRRDFEFLDIGGPAQVGWVIDDLCQSGASGNAAAATREKGEIILDRSARGLARFLAEFDRFEMPSQHD
jgi:creatinine amidohydrolase/Fe(II)-dependent formamide hydrolase-like protein